uniref:C-type lectin domain-containing protein n=1 Tax=Caenorhabditis tropicalis TaxID=1561998 RepID=A0A1I7UKL8_9PELO
MIKKPFLLIFFYFLVTVSGKKDDSCDEKPCDKGWKLFERPSGGWCIKIFYEDNIKKASADLKCTSQNATLTSLQNQLESLYIALTVSKKIAPGSGSIWIGVTRREACRNVTRTTTCNSGNSFEWTDRSATGIDGLLWGANQPDNAGLNQDCVVLQAGSTAYVSGMQMATLDDMKCDLDFVGTGRVPRKPVAYACGKKRNSDSFQ